MRLRSRRDKLAGICIVMFANVLGQYADLTDQLGIRSGLTSFMPLILLQLQLKAMQLRDNGREAFIARYT